MTITEFLEARITEDEAAARAANAWASHGGPTQWIGQPGDRLVVRLGAGGPHIARHSPARVLAECAAKRAILDTYHGATEWARNSDCPDVQAYSGMACGLGDALRALTAIYKDHPDYDEGWAL